MKDGTPWVPSMVAIAETGSGATAVSNAQPGKAKPEKRQGTRLRNLVANGYIVDAVAIISVVGVDLHIIKAINEQPLKE